MPERPFKVPRKTVAAVVAILLAVLASAGVIVVTDDPAPAPAPVATATPTPTAAPHELGGPGHATVPAAVSTPAGALESDLRAQPAIPSATVEHNDDLKPPGQPAVPEHIPLAAPSVAGCKTALVRNFSSRNGAPVLLGVIHWTGSPVTPGWSGIDGNLKWFDTLAASASSNEITDSWGNCALAVPEAQKAWTQAGFNPWAVSVEIVNPGVLPLFRSQAGFDRVVDLIVGWHQRWKIPLQRGLVSGCKVIRVGILAHKDLGACGGGHPDVGNGGDVDRLIAAAKARVAAGASPGFAVLTKGERAAADLLVRERKVAERHGGWGKVDASHLARAVTAKDALRRANSRLHEAAAKTGWDRLNRRERHSLIHALI